jgi:hypothetical protein
MTTSNVVAVLTASSVVSSVADPGLDAEEARERRRREREAANGGAEDEDDVPLFRIKTAHV